MIAALTAAPAFAAVTPYSWIRGGETGSVFTDSTANAKNFNAAFSTATDGAGLGGNPSAIISPTGAGGPLGGVAGPISAVATRWGGLNTRTSGMWIQGPNSTPPTVNEWSLPATNWVVECWVLPIGTGTTESSGSPNSEFISTGSNNNGHPTPGGVAFRTTYKLVDENDPEGPSAVFFRLDAIGPATENRFTIGSEAIADLTRWTHLAAVNDNGVVTFYVNGVASGDSATNVTAPSGSPTIGSGPDTRQPFNGYLDEIRYSTFAPGQFALSDLLLRSLAPSLIAQPQSASVWNGGAAPFEVAHAIDESTTYQWKLGGADIAGAIGPELLVPAVTPAQSGGVYSVALTNADGTVTSADATLTVVPNKTEDVAFYRAAVQAEASLVAFFPVDGDTGTTATNIKNNALNGTLGSGASYDGRTTRSLGERALRFKGDSQVTVPNNPAFEFTNGSGTIEAIVYQTPTVGSGLATLFSLAGPEGVYYQLQAGFAGVSLQLDNDTLEQPVSWSVPNSLSGRFAHVAVVFAPGTVTAYVDGESLGTKDLATFGITTGLPVNIGSSGVDFEGVAQTPWTGTIDELAVYSGSLSAATIALHNSRFVFGTAVAPPTITSQPTGDKSLLAGGAPVFRVTSSGTAPLTYQWKLNGTPIAGNATATTATLVLNNSTTAMSGNYTVTVTNPQGSADSAPFAVTFTAPPDLYSGYVLTDNPTAYWRLNEAAGAVLKDYAGGLDGTYASTVSLGASGAPGVSSDAAAQFAGAGTPVPNAIVPFTPTLNPSSAFSLEFWVRPDQSGLISRAVVGNQNRNTGRAGYAVYQGFNVNAWEAHLGIGETVLFIQGQTPPVAGRWDHVVVTWNGVDTARLYVNGRDDTTADSSVGGPHRPNLSVPFEIGSRFGSGIPYPGTIDEVAFYSHALTPAQIEKHWSVSWVPAAIVQAPPAAVGASEAGTVTLTTEVTGYPNTYQWLKNGEPLEAAVNPDGSAHYPQGTTSPSLVISQAAAADGGVYRLVITNPLGNQQTADIALTVTPDTTPPTITYVSADASLRRVRVGFDRWVTPETAALAANYTFTGGLTASSVALTNDASVVDVVTSAQVPGASYTLSVTGVKDQRASQNLIGANTTPFQAYVLTPGVLAMDFYSGIPGTAVSDLQSDPQYPDGVLTTEVLTSFSTSPLTGGNLATNPRYGARGDNYGVHLYGWITPTVSGNYTFFLRSDDASELWLSTDATPGAVVPVAFEPGCCDPFKEPSESNTETSTPVPLVAGTKYFVEVFNKEGGGGDFVEVAWRLEGDATPAASLTPIPGTFLSAYAPAIPLGALDTPVFANGQVTLTWTGVGALEESDDLKTWTPVAGNPTSPYTTPGAGKRYYRLAR